MIAPSRHPQPRHRAAPAAFLALCLACAAALAPRAPAAPAEAVTRTPTSVDESIAKNVVRLVTRGHFSRPDLDDKISAALFDEYFARLDPEHHVFLTTDLDDFSPYRQILDDHLREGNLDFGFAVYERFLDRLRARVAYVRLAVAQPQDYSVAEELVADRTEVGWPATTADLDELWRKEVKNQLLVFTMAEEEEKAAAAAAPGAAPGAAAPEDAPLDLTRLPGSKVKTTVERVVQRHERLLRWAEDRDTQDVMEIYLSTFTQLYDPHSTYFNARSYEDFTIEMRLSFEGIGLTLSSVDGYTVVVKVLPGGPADLDGRLKPGDLIVAVGQADGDPEDVVNVPLERVVRRIRGEGGTVVRLMVQKTPDDTPSEVSLTRGKVTLADKGASSQVLPVAWPDGRAGKVGVVRLPGFYADQQALRGDSTGRSASLDTRRLLDQLIAEHHIDGLVMDLRGNGGGYLVEAVALTGLFIKNGPVVQTRYANETEVREDTDDTVYDLPLVVLVDRGTASASEIFAAAIQDYGRGVVVGDAQTHGKGTVQDVMDLKRAIFSLRGFNPGALKYTVAKYYRITGLSTQNRGVQSDIVLPSLRDNLQIGEAFMKHTLGLDEIAPQPFATPPHTVARLLPALQANSAKRLAADPLYRDLVRLIGEDKERRERKVFSLNRDARLAQRQADETWIEQRDKVLAALSEQDPDAADADDPEPGAPEAPASADFYLTEAGHVLADLVALSQPGQIAREAAAPAAPAPDSTQGVPR